MHFSIGYNIPSVSASDVISGHSSVAVDLRIPSNYRRSVPQTIKYRKMKVIKIGALKVARTNNSELIRYPQTNATELAEQYNSALHTSITVHDQMVTRNISPKPPDPRMTPDIVSSKRHHRYMEHICRRNPTALNWPRLSRQTHLNSKQMSKGKSAHNFEIISGLSGNHHYRRYLTK